MARLVGLIISLTTIILAFFLPVTAALAQAPDADLTITYVEASALNTGEVRVSAFVSVVNPDGKPYTRLSAGDFSVFENNTPVDPKLLTAALSTTPITFTLLLDTSSSMAKAGPSGIRAIDTAKDASAAFIQTLRENDQVAIFDYAGQLHSQLDFTYDHNLAIDQGLAPLNATAVEATCMYDALLSVVETLQAKGAGQRAVILITGNPNNPAGGSCGTTTLDDVLEGATTVGNTVPIFSIGFGRNVNQDELAQISQRTGGRSFVAPDSTALPALLATLSEQLKNQYEISYPTQATSGPARISVVEHSSQAEDRRQVFVPAKIEPTPTPPPQFAIDLSVDQRLEEGRLEVNVAVPADVTLTKTELFINNKLDQEKVEPPFDRFDLDVTELGSGRHNIRVQATDQHGTTASAEVELSLSLAPTPVPTASPPPTPTAAATAIPAASSALGDIPLVPLLLIVAGLILLVVLIGLIVYLIFFYARRSAVAVPAPSPAPLPINPMPTVNEVFAPPPAQRGPSPNDQQELLARRAKLVVLAGQPAVSQTVYMLQKLETKIGRNTAKEATNEIPVQEKEVSRSHSKIIYHHHQFFIQDLDSATGTQVNGIRLKPFQEVALDNGAEIRVGPHVKFRFEFFVPRSILETLDDYADEDMQTKSESEDADRTLYDL